MNHRLVWLVSFVVTTAVFGFVLGPVLYPMGGGVTIAHLVVGAGAGWGIASWIAKQIGSNR